MYRLIAMDIDGVITDGKQYVSENGEGSKSICFQDIDMMNEWKEEGILLAIITGENNSFTDYLENKLQLTHFYSDCKDKVVAMEEIRKKYNLDWSEIVYIGDSKYDIELLKLVGISVCPSNALPSVKRVCTHVLKNEGGANCIAELYDYLKHYSREDKNENDGEISEIVTNSILSHLEVIKQIQRDVGLLKTVDSVSRKAIQIISEGGRILVCGNGGSAADAQHFAAELVGRFYLERKAIDAEALTVDTSVITSVGNDYSFDTIFARQVEAKAKTNDILIGITTSGDSDNVKEAFIVAKERKLTTVLLTGSDAYGKEVCHYSDYVLAVPSKDTPRIQEMHILLIHMLCERIEAGNEG